MLFDYFVKLTAACEELFEYGYREDHKNKKVLLEEQDIPSPHHIKEYTQSEETNCNSCDYCY